MVRPRRPEGAIIRSSGPTWHVEGFRGHVWGLLGPGGSDFGKEIGGGCRRVRASPHCFAGGERWLGGDPPLFGNRFGFLSELRAMAPSFSTISMHHEPSNTETVNNSPRAICHVRMGRTMEEMQPIPGYLGRQR